MINTIQVRRFDLGQITSVERTPQGFLKVPGFATRIGVFVYLDGAGTVRRELRHPDDVFDPESLATLKYAPVTLEHPPSMVTPENVKQYTVGHSTERVEVNRNLVETDLIIEDEKAISAVIDNGMRELSSGYNADLEEERGDFNGAQYDYRQRNIRYNHIAIVKKGRAGPEARLRLDSADAVMQSEGETHSMDEGKQQETKPVVISGQKLDLPTGIADIVQDMMDRYDQMRGQLAKLQEDIEMKDKKDVDINQKGISPQVDVKQMPPDGRNAPAKAGAGDKGGVSAAKGDEDQHGVIGGVKPNSAAGGSKALKDAEEEEDKKDAGENPFEKKKEDYEAPGGAGAGMSPVDQLKQELEEMNNVMNGMKAKHDAMQAKLDEYASQGLGKGEKGPQGAKMDSADVKSYIRGRVKLERTAERLLPESVVSRFDSMSDNEIRTAVIQHKHPSADLSDKSTVYLESRFDSVVESMHEGQIVRKEMGSHLLGTRMDSKQTVDPSSTRRAMIEKTRNLWQEPLSANKK